MASGKKQFVAPMFEPELFREQMVLEKVIVTLLGLFGAPNMTWRPGNCAPSFPPSLRPWLQNLIENFSKRYYVHGFDEQNTSTWGVVCGGDLYNEFVCVDNNYIWLWF